MNLIYCNYLSVKCTIFPDFSAQKLETCILYNDYIMNFFLCEGLFIGVWMNENKSEQTMTECGLLKFLCLMAYQPS